MTTIAFIGAAQKQLQATLERQVPAVRALVLEPNPRTAEAMRARRDWTEWTAAGKLVLLSGPEYQGAPAVARAFPDLHAAEVVVDPALVDEDAASVGRAREVLARLTFATKANDGARRASAGRYLLHTLANVPRLSRESDVRTLAGIGTGRAAVVAAAGPSLDVNIHDLAPYADRAIVIACDTAARPLAFSSIEPDFVVASDPTPANAWHLTALPVKRSWLVAEGSLHPTAFSSFDRRAFMFRVSAHQPWPWLASIGLDRGVLTTWGSVATSAFSLAVTMGCDPIVFVGADFAFTGGRPYCRGTSFEAQWSTWLAGGSSPEEIWDMLVRRWPPVIETGVDGQPARTASHLVAFRDWMVEQSVALSDRRLINATGAGLLHGGRVEQASVWSVLADRLRIDREEFHRTVRAAHVSARGNVARTLGAVGDVIASAAHPHRSLWREFTDGTVPDTAVDLALKSPEFEAWSLS